MLEQLPEKPFRSDLLGEFYGAETGAEFSEDRKYRYTLWRIWDRSKGLVMFIALNPSTADETQDDPTVRRCIDYAHRWGYGGLYMMNLFAFRATDPKEMKAVEDPVGPMNDEWLLRVAREATIVVGAWGSHGIHNGRWKQVEELIPKMYCLGKTKKDQQPRHPLYLRKDAYLIPWGG